MPATTPTQALLTDPMVPILADLALRGTLWLLLAIGAAGLARTSAGRHLALTVGLLGVLALPLATVITPAWSLPVLPAGDPSPYPGGADLSQPAPALPKATVVIATTAREAAATTSLSKPTPRQPPPGPSRIPTLLWLAGATLVAAELALDGRRRLRLARSATSVGDASWLGDAAALAKQLGTPTPRLLATHQIAVPITWGTRRPVIVLPQPALDWNAEHRRYALIHELAHVRRADALICGLGRLVCAIAWFHPLVWWVASRQRAESELACDDRVVAAGASPSIYAGELVALARRLRPEPFSTAAALARPAKLSQRIRAILDRNRNRTALNAGRILGLLFVACALALPAVAGVRLTHRDASSVLEAQAALRWFRVGDRDGSKIEAPARPPAEPTRPAAPASPTSPEPPSAVAAQAPAATRIAALSPPAAPAAPAAPSAPAAPGVPVSDSFLRDCPGRQHSSSHANNANWDITVKAGPCRFDFEMRGDIVFRDDETGIERMGRNALFAIDERRPDARRSLRIEGTSREPSWTWEVDGDERPVDAEARAWLAQMIPALFRTTGYQAEERTQRILQRGGPGSVLDEIEILSSDYVRRRYFIALIEATPLDGGQQLHWVRLAGTTIANDYELASTLTHLPAAALTQRELQVAFVDAARTIESDYELRRALTPLVETTSLSPEVLPLIVELAADIQSDYELATLLVALADRYASSAALPDAFLQAAETIESDYELARALKKALEHPLGTSALNRLLDAALSIQSDYELANVLVRVAEQHVLEGGTRQSFQRALDSIQGGYERQRVQRASSS